MQTNLKDKINNLLQEYSYKEIETELQAQGNNNIQSENILTIVANAGVHQFPKEYLHGEIYEASHGNFKELSLECITNEMQSVLKKLNDKLNEKLWDKIYLMPTGHPVISANIKSFVYRVRRLNTIDILYINGKYFEVSIDHRHFAIEENKDR